MLKKLHVTQDVKQDNPDITTPEENIFCFMCMMSSPL